MLDNLKNLEWGTFSASHIVSLIFGIFIIALLFFTLKNKSERFQNIVLGILSFSGIAAIIFNLVTWGSPIEYLPFHLCSINALILPFAVLTKNQVVKNIPLLWSFGALCALVLNHAQGNFKICSWTFFFYFFPHLLEFGIPLLLLLLKRVKLGFKYVVTTIIVTFSSYTLIHLINLLLNAYVAHKSIIDASGELIFLNYMYSIEPPVNPALELFYKIIPTSYWYMFLSLPLIFAYLLIINLPSIIRKRRKAKEV
jgi:uncharacterized membrane protein YwaF